MKVMYTKLNGGHKVTHLVRTLFGNSLLKDMTTVAMERTKVMGMVEMAKVKVEKVMKLKLTLGIHQQFTQKVTLLNMKEQFTKLNGGRKVMTLLKLESGELGKLYN